MLQKVGIKSDKVNCETIASQDPIMLIDKFIYYRGTIPANNWSI